MPEISVIMCAYNAERTILESINSIINQSFSNIELIIIDDGSTDNTKKIIDNVKDSRILFLQQENTGPSVARSNGIKNSRGEYIAILDADDVAFPKRLELQISFLKNHPDYVLIGSNAEVVDRNNEYIYTTNLPLSWEEIKKHFPDTPFYHSSVMYLKSSYQLCGGYHTLNKLFIFEDALLFNKMKNFGKMANLKEPFIRYRLMPDSASVRSEKDASKIITIYQEIIKENFLSEKNLSRLATIKENVDQQERLRAYYLLIAKKYLWNNYSPKQARMNLSNAIKIKPCKADQIALWLMSFLPKKLVFGMYSLKRRYKEF